MNHIVEFQKRHGLLADGILGKKTIQKMRCEFGIETDAQMAHFLSQVHHETGGFKADTENLNYSALRLRQIFPKYFPNDNIARQYANKPEKIANRVYANRMGNGDELSGDGWLYRGRGALQSTGKDNYKAFSDYVKDIDVMLNPSLVATKYYWESALFYFTKNNLWNKMKGSTDNDIKLIRKAVNGGYNGLYEVESLFKYYYNLITK